MTQEYRDQEDILGDFLRHRCVEDPQARVGSTELFEAYQAHTADMETKQKGFANLMQRRGFRSDKFTSGTHKGKVGWFGVGLLQSQDAVEGG